MIKPGTVISFEGLDYSFKETNTKKLYEYIKENITDKVILLSFPNYGSISSTFVKEYLSGKYGKASELGCYESSLCYAIDRYDTIMSLNIKDKIKEGYIIVIDRYVESNIIFQSTKLKTIEEINKYIDWTIDLEYDKAGLPKPDLTIFMDMPVEVSHKLMLERELKNGMGTDGHESDYNFMFDVEKNAKNIIIPKLKIKTIHCLNEDNNIKSEEEIFDNIIELIEKELTIY